MNYALDTNKRPKNICVGMEQRSPPTLNLVHHKHIILLNDIFTGLDRDLVVDVMNNLVKRRN